MFKQHICCLHPISRFQVMIRGTSPRNTSKSKPIIHTFRRPKKERNLRSVLAKADLWKKKTKQDTSCLIVDSRAILLQKSPLIQAQCSAGTISGTRRRG